MIIMVKETNYTKGEWEAREHVNGSHWFVDGGEHQDDRITIADELSEGDANLIASAPDLLEALKYIIRELDKANIIKADSIFMAMPQKAIAKAEGK